MTMMTAANGNHQQLGSVQQQEADQMESEYYDKNEDCWCSVIRTVVGKHVFDVCQFITCKEDEMFGSEWQQEVCSKARVKKKYQELFWRKKGMREARKPLNRRRQNTTNSMKKPFLGKT